MLSTLSWIDLSKSGFLSLWFNCSWFTLCFSWIHNCYYLINSFSSSLPWLFLAERQWQAWRYGMVTNLLSCCWRCGHWGLLGSGARDSVDCARDPISTYSLRPLLAEEHPMQPSGWQFVVCSRHLLLAKWKSVSVASREPQTPKAVLMCWVIVNIVELWIMEILFTMQACYLKSCTDLCIFLFCRCVWGLVLVFFNFILFFRVNLFRLGVFISSWHLGE